MRLRDVLGKITGEFYLLTIDEICDELSCGEDVLNELREQDYYKKNRDRKVKSISVAVKNMRPELRIALEK